MRGECRLLRKVMRWRSEEWDCIHGVGVGMKSKGRRSFQRESFV